MSGGNTQQVAVLVPGIVVLQHRDLHLPPPTTDKMLHNKKTKKRIKKKNHEKFPASIPNLGCVLKVFVACPRDRQQVGAKERGHKAHHHRILDEGGEELGGARWVHQVGRHKERAAEEGEVVAEALGERGRALSAHLGKQGDSSVGGRE